MLGAADVLLLARLSPVFVTTGTSPELGRGVRTDNERFAQNNDDYAGYAEGALANSPALARDCSTMAGRASKSTTTSSSA